MCTHCVRNSVVDEERMRPGRCFVFSLVLTTQRTLWYIWPCVCVGVY